LQQARPPESADLKELFSSQATPFGLKFLAWVCFKTQWSKGSEHGLAKLNPI